jgi:hypothetical protein
MGKHKAAGRRTGGLVAIRSEICRGRGGNRMSWRRRTILLAVGLTALGATMARGATPPEARERLCAGALEYAQTLYSSSYSLVVDETLRPDYVRFSPGYVVAALTRGDAGKQVVATLNTILAAQDANPHSPTRGLFPQDVYTGTPGLEATCQLLPLLAWVHDHGQALPPDVQGKVGPALESAYRVVERTKAAPEHPYLTLLRAAALATAGQSLGHPEGLGAAQSEAGTWLKRQLGAGCWEGHGATAEALRLGALAWIAQVAGGKPSPEVRMALRLAYLDLLQRVQPGSGALAGAASFVQGVDYVQGGDMDRYLLYLWGAGEEPPQLRPSAMYLAACAWTPDAALLSTGPLALPRTVTTTAREGAPVTRTDTYLTDLFSLGTMTGAVGMRAVPVMITLADSPKRPTAYLYAYPTPAAVSAVQQEGRAAVTVAFNQIGAPDREQAYVTGVLGPRQEITGVLVNGGEWNGEAVAVGMGSVVTWQRAGVYLGISLGLCGPAQPSQRTETTKPGTLRWQGDTPSSELELLVYGRKQTYGLVPAIDNVLVGVAVQVAPQSAFPDLKAFSSQMLAERLVQRVTTSVEKLAPDEDPHTAFLNENKPKTKMQYRYVAHVVLDSVLREGDQALLHQQVDLATGRVLLTETAGAPVAAAGPWQSPLLNLPWDQGAARQMLAAGP